MFLDFDNYLLSDFSDDYWSDEGIGLAEKKLSLFLEDDWIVIQNEWRKRNSTWVIRCTDVLGDSDNINSMKLLISFLDQKNIELQIATLDSINALLNVNAGKIEIKTIFDLKSKVDSINHSSIVVNTMLTSLKNKLKQFS